MIFSMTVYTSRALSAFVVILSYSTSDLHRVTYIILYSVQCYYSYTIYIILLLLYTAFTLLLVIHAVGSGD